MTINVNKLAKLFRKLWITDNKGNPNMINPLTYLTMILITMSLFGMVIIDRISTKVFYGKERN